jgi:hypothetical protein
MKTTYYSICFSMVIGVLFAVTPQLHAQGTLYLSNLGEASYNGGPFNDGENSIFSPSASFVTGANSGGYVLDSIQVLMGDSGIGPGSFNISIFSDNDGQPGSSLGSLSGSPSPYISGIYTYTSSGIALSSSTPYWILMTSDSPYIWEDTLSANYTSSDGWSEIPAISGQQLQFGINADPAGVNPVPEPQTLALMGLGAMAFFFRRRK